MKKLIIIAVALLAFQSYAQGQKKQAPANHERMQKMQDLTPEEAANLQTKKMTLHLDLNDKQQKEIYKINLENATKRKEMMANFKAKKESGQMENPSKEERLKMMNAKLDHQIATKAKMKAILNPEQYAKWEKIQAKKAHHKGGGKKGEGKHQGERMPKQ